MCCGYRGGRTVSGKVILHSNLKHEDNISNDSDDDSDNDDDTSDGHNLGRDTQGAAPPRHLSVPQLPPVRHDKHKRKAETKT